MGGVAGPMMHLYNDPSLTFNKIKKILSAASQGEIEGTEKTDGYNIYLGYVGGKPRAARNKGDMSKGGMDFGLLAAREFKGGPEVRKVYLDAFRAYGKALDTLSDKELAAIFGENGEIFYNTEIQGPSAEQLVNYDANVVSIHYSGHKIYNPETNELEIVDASANSAALNRVIDRFEEALQGESFSVRRTAALILNRLDDDYDLNIALNKMQKAGFSGSMTIEEFLESKIMEYLDEKLGYFSDEVKQNAVDRILKKEGSLGIPQIAKGFPAAQRSTISTVIKYGPALKKKYIFPIEDAIHDFSVELLRGLQSAYILDNDAEVTRLKDEVAEAIKTIQAYTGPGVEEAHEMLYQQLKKLKHHGNINTAVEGFVFQIGDQIYKFTGNFAPANQLLGLFKYGRGKAPPLKGQSLNEVDKYFDYPSEQEIPPILNEPSTPEDKKYLVIIPGGFKPPHLGHYRLIKAYLDHPSVERIAIIIGDLERTDSEGRISVGYDEAVRTWKEYGISEGSNVTLVRARKRQNKKGEDYENPMADAYDLVQEIDPRELKQANMAIAMGASTKGGDYERAVKFAQSHQPGSQYYREGIEVTEPPVKVAAEDYVYPQDSRHAGEPISATYMREAIAEGDLQEFSYHIPEVARKSDNDLGNLMNDLAGRETYVKQEPANYDDDTTATPPLNPAALYNIAEGVDLYHLIEKVVEGNLDVEKALEELSSMAGGSVEIGVGAGKRDKKKKKPTIFREDEEEQTAVDAAINPILQSFEELEAERAHAKEAIVNYLKDHGPTLETDMRWSLIQKGHRREDLIAGVNELDAQETNRIGRYYKWGEIKSWMLYLIPEHQHMVPGADPQATMFEQTEAEDISKEQLSTLKMQIIYYLLAHGPKPADDVVLHLRLSAHHSLFSLEELHKAASWAFSELKREEKITWREENNEEVWFLIPQHALFLANTQEPLLHQEDRGVRGADPQSVMFEQVGDIPKEQLEALKWQIIYFLLANGPKPGRDIIRFAAGFRQNRHAQPLPAEKATEAVLWALGELKREEKITQRREEDINWWYLIPQHADLLSQAGEQEEMFFQEDKGVRGLPGSNNPSARDADDRTNEEDPETGKTGNVGPKYKIAREHSEVDEVVNYLLDVGVFTG